MGKIIVSKHFPALSIGSVNIVKGLTFWVEAVNVLNSEQFSYFGNKSRVYNLQYSGANGRCGFTYKF